MIRNLDKEDIRRMGIPQAYWSVRTEDLPKPVLLKLRQYVAKLDTLVAGGYGITLSGKAGVGKTSAAVALAKAATRRGVYSYFMMLADLRVFIDEGITFDRDHSVLERVRTVPMLILDSVGPLPPKDIILSPTTLASIIESRAQNNRVTIITTRLNLMGMKEHHPTLMEYLAKKNKFLPIEGPDLRASERHPLDADEPAPPPEPTKEPTDTAQDLDPEDSIFTSK